VRNFIKIENFKQREEQNFGSTDTSGRKDGKGEDDFEFLHGIENE